MPAMSKESFVKRLKKQFNRKKLVKDLDDAHSLYIRTRDKFTCFTCGKSREHYPDVVFQCGHLISRVRSPLKYDELNNHCQCAGCNMKHEHYPEVYTQKFIEKYGSQAYTNLCNTAWMKSQKMTKSEILILTDHFRRLTAKLQEEQRGTQ